RGNPSNAHMIAKEHRVRLGPHVGAIIDAPERVYQLTPEQKATVAALDNASGLAEYDVLASAFLESLRNYGAFDRMLPLMRRVPFRRRIGAVTTAAGASTTPQASAKVISRFSLAQQQIDEIKVVAILILTAELARFGGSAAGDLFGTELSNAVAVQ